VNRQIRRVAVAVGVMMGALLLNLDYVQVLKSDAYRNDDRNSRVILATYSRPRGQIVVEGMPVADSVATKDELKYLRRYPSGPEYAAVTGHYTRDYGLDGIEATEDDVLSGNDPRLLGRRIADILTGRDPQGGTIVLTLNKAAQDAAYKALGGRRGAVVALDPSTGAILAAVSSPSYDPNLLSSHKSDDVAKAWRAYNADADQPMLNRALLQNYPPGSVFKVVVAAAALKRGLKPEEKIPAPSVLQLPESTVPMKNFDGEKCGDGQTDTLQDALAISCNTAFGQLGMDLGTDSVRKQAELFGMDGEQRKTPLRTAQSSIGEVVDQAALAQTSIGQRSVVATPLQVAMISAAVANDGVLMKPYLVQREQAPNLSTLHSTDPELLSTVLDPTLDKMLQQMMVAVVKNGTGKKADINIPGVVVGGKTGTADNGPTDHLNAPHAWFSGYATRQGVPKIAVAVVLENAGVTGSESAGGAAAAPIAKDVMTAYLNDAASD